MKFVSKLSQGSVICSELQVKHYKEIIKCSLGDEPDIAIFIETITSVLSSIINEPNEYIKNLSIIDVLCLLIDIRYNSLGMCNLVVNQRDKKFNLEMNLEISKNEISSIFNSLEETAASNDIEILLKVPSLARLYEAHKEDYIPYISACKFNATKTFEITTNEQAVKAFDLFPPKLSLEIISKVNSLVSRICTIDLLKQYNIPNQQLIVLPTIEFLIWFTKLLFGEDLSSFYDNLFSLSYSGKMNAEYVENLPVGEYNYFIGLLRQTLAPKDANSSSAGDPLPNMMDGML